MKYILSTLSILLFTGCSIYGQATIGDPPNPPSPPEQPIIGTWINMKDAKSKWVFTGSPEVVQQYYNNELSSTYSYTFYSSLPPSSKCGNALSQNSNPDLKFLVLEDDSNNLYHCYTVYGITEDYLTINPIKIGRIIRFEKE